MTDYNDAEQAAAGYARLREIIVKAETIEQFREAVGGSPHGVLVSLGEDDGVWAFGGLTGMGMFALYNMISAAIEHTVGRMAREDAMLAHPAGEA